MIVFYLIVNSFCWWGGPHYAVARIAELGLTNEQRIWITNLFSTWESEPGTVSSVASWQDDIKGLGSKIFIMSNWHFRNEPIFQSPFFLNEVPRQFNISNVLHDLIESILNPTTTSLWSLGFSFRSLIHFVADAHTPLHSSGRWSIDHPTGDV